MEAQCMEIGSVRIPAPAVHFYTRADAPKLVLSAQRRCADPFLFPPMEDSRNYVASFLLFDPNRGRAGVSGHSTSCRSPANRDLELRCAFGIGHAHEFTHSFA